MIELDRPDEAPGGAAAMLLDAHGMQPDLVLSMLGVLGGQAGRVLLVGCEPASIDYGIGLSPPVAAAVGPAVRAVLDLIGAERREPSSATGQPRRRVSHGERGRENHVPGHTR